VGTHPVEVKSFVGRRQEVAEAKRLLAVGSSVTLVGVAGVGKTRLALRLAGELEHSFPDGVWPVDLAPLQDEELVAHTVASAVGLYEDARRPPLTQLREHLAGKRLLLIMDHCDHLLDGTAAVAAKLLRAAPHLRILATSKEPLGIEGERVLPLAPLSVPDGVAGLPSYVARRFDAVALFAERASDVAPTFTLNDVNCRAVVRVCQRLRGLPLAIELAALRLHSQSVAALLDEFTAHDEPGAEPTTRPQRPAGDTVAWASDLCAPRERALWARLSVFTGGFDVEDIRQVCCGGGIPRDDVPALMERLAAKSIVLVEERGPRTRYRMPETLRHCGRELLAHSGQDLALRRRHRDWYQRMVAQMEADWFGPRQLEWYQRLHRVWPNLQAALDFCVTEPGEANAALAMAAALWPYWTISGSLTEGRRRLDRALRLAREPSPARAKALWVDAWLAMMQADMPTGRHLLAQCRVLAQQIGDRAALTRTVQHSGVAALYEEDFPRALRLLRDALARQRVARDVNGVWLALFHLAISAYDLADSDRSRTGGRVASFGEECLAMAEARNAEWCRSYGLWVVGLERLRAGDTRRATTLVRASLRLKRPFNDRWGMALCLETLGWTAAEEGRHERAARLLGMATTLWRSMRTSPPLLGHIAGSHGRWEARARNALGDRAFAAALTSGAALDLEHAVSEALDERTYHPARHREPVPPGRAALTRRERQVAALVAQGLANREIAARLVIAQRTAESHVENILNKLGFTRRTQIADWVARGIGLRHGSSARRPPPEVGSRASQAQHRAHGGRRVPAAALAVTGGFTSGLAA